MLTNYLITYKDDYTEYTMSLADVVHYYLSDGNAPAVQRIAREYGDALLDEDYALAFLCEKLDEARHNVQIPEVCCALGAREARVVGVDDVRPHFEEPWN